MSINNSVLYKKENAAIIEFVYPFSFIIFVYKFNKFFDIWFDKSKLQKLVIGFIKPFFLSVF